MIEKIGAVKNPLTVIAIFAGIAEVSGTVILPFIADTNQITFIYFLIIFPSILVILFFLTLNFNNKALYAPSDFSNEENYIKIFKYDLVTQQKVEVKISQEDLLANLNSSLSELKFSMDSRFQKIEAELKTDKKKIENVETLPSEIIDEDYEIPFEEEDNLITIVNFPRAKSFLRTWRQKGFPTMIYNNDNKIVTDFKNSSAIWLGSKFEFTQAKQILLSAKKQYPHLKYIEFSDNKTKPPRFIHYQIFIGGSTEAAQAREVRPLSEEDWKYLEEKITTSKNFVEFIRSFE
ncbi:hypothetical protein [Chryseobacterium cheonjiense]|uniref:hypothetical protein n=1 Tax=Chryseobacterium cheonjiense TaxID=2728845 RepID=UPI00162505C5|nr:hypothetical protein [Chryseobacterium cheonjiense]